MNESFEEWSYYLRKICFVDPFKVIFEYVLLCSGVIVFCETRVVLDVYKGHIELYTVI